MNSPKKIIILFLIFGKDHLEEGILETSKIVERMFPGIELEWVIIDNAAKVSVQTIANKHYIHGDNKYFEFTGWDKGVKYAKEHFVQDEQTLYLFVNDTFYRRSYSDGENFLDIFDKKILNGHNVLSSAIGYLDDFPKIVRLDDIEYRHWIRSNIFFLPQKVLNQVYPLSFPFPLSKVFSENPTVFWSSDPLISENWKAYINSWLFGDEDPDFPEYRLHWLKSSSLTNENRDFFQRKTITILSEHYLTARLFKYGINIINTNVFPTDPLRHIKSYYKVK